MTGELYQSTAPSLRGRCAFARSNPLLQLEIAHRTGARRKCRRAKRPPRNDGIKKVPNLSVTGLGLPHSVSSRGRFPECARSSGGLSGSGRLEGLFHGRHYITLVILWSFLTSPDIGSLLRISRLSHIMTDSRFLRNLYCCQGIHNICPN
jgi:hypothetical protein